MRSKTYQYYQPNKKKEEEHKMRKYRVNGSEHFNLISMYEHLKCLEIEMIEEYERFTEEQFDELLDRIEEVEKLMDKAPCIGARVDWTTLKRIREIRDERNLIRYSRALENGASEKEAGYAFM